MAVLLGNLLALSFIDNFAVFLGDVLTQLLLDSLALLVVDHLTDSLSVGDALPLLHGLALPLQLGAALLVGLGGALLLVDDLGDGPGHGGALQLGHGEALLLVLGVALLGDVIGSFAVLLEGEPALLPLHLLLHWSLGHLALPLLDIGADLVRNLGTLSLGHRVVLHWTRHLSAVLDWLLLAHLVRYLLSDSLGHLVTHLLGYLATHWLRLPGSWGRVELVGETREGEDDGETHNTLHFGVYAKTDPLYSS